MVYIINENYRLKRLALLVKGKAKVLDIGCSQTPNLYLANQVVEGVDVVSRQMPGNYTDFHLGELGILVKQRQKYDAIVAGEIVEHLENPIKFLRECYTLLNKKGILVLSTPNPLSPIEFFLNMTLSKKYYYSSEHIMLFPQRWLIRMLEYSGFAEVKLYSGGFPLPGLGLIPCPRFICHQTIALAKRL